MPFPAFSVPASFAIGIPLGLAGFAAQEAVLRRRSVKRGAEAAPETASRAPVEAPAAPGVTAVVPGVPVEAPAEAVAEAVVAKPAVARPTAVRKKRAPADPRAALRRRHAALSQGLEAIIAFVDGAPRRAAATACADALLLALPVSERGPQVAAFLHAVGAKLPPGKLQELAEDAGVEVATSIRMLARQLSASAK